MRFHSFSHAALPLLFLALAAALGWTGVDARSVEPGALAPPPRMQGLPFYFEANQGQTDERVAFLARARGYTAFVEPDRLTLGVGQGRAAAVTMGFVGADPDAAVRGVDELPGKVNYFKGREPESWRTKILTFDRVRVDEAYPGIDIVYYGVGRQVAFDAVVAPGADPGCLRLAFDGAAGVEIDEQGDLIVDLGLGKLRLPRPIVYQEDRGQRIQIAGRYVIHDGQVGVEVGPYDTASPLVIDPILDLVYSTYYGGGDFEIGADVAVGPTGQLHVIGETESTDFPTGNALQPSFAGGANGGDAFAVKLTADGSALVYATYLGGEQDDVAWGIDVDLLGNTFVVGRTFSDDFPLMNALQEECFVPQNNNCQEGFVSKINTEGSALVYSTLLGGSEADNLADVDVDAAGNAYVAGESFSDDFPIVNPVQGARAGVSDTVIAKLNPEGSALLYSTYLGGDGVDRATNIAVDTAGKACVLGVTASDNFPTVQPLQPERGGDTDIYITKIESDGSSLAYSTYLGGSGGEGAEGGIAVDSEGAVYVTSSTLSADFPTVNPLQSSYSGGDSAGDAVVSKIAPDGSGLVYSTFLGGAFDDTGLDIAVDSVGSAYITGFTQSDDFPTANAWQPNYGGGLRETFLSKLTPTGSALVFSTFFGGNTDDSGLGIALGPDELDVYVSGRAELPGEMPILNAIQPDHGGETDVFVARFTQTLQPQVRLQPFVVRFGVVPVGTPKVRRFFAFNDGDLPLTISQIDGLEPPFGLLWPQLPFTLQPGEASPVFVGWQPTSPGPLVKAVPVTSNDPDDPVKGVLLRGAAVNTASQEGENK